MEYGIVEQLIDQIMFLKSGRNIIIDRLIMSYAVCKILAERSDYTMKKEGKVITEFYGYPVMVSPRLEGQQVGIEYKVNGIEHAKMIIYKGVLRDLRNGRYI